jgi:hypothetical protein
VSRAAFSAIVGLLALAAQGSSSADVMMGAHVGSPGDTNWQGEFLSLESSIGRKLAIDSDYSDWAEFPDVTRIKWDIQTGHLPMQSWRILFDDLNPNACATAAAITAGTYDTQLTQQANALKKLGVTILVRYNYEMTDNQENTCFTGFPVAQNTPLAGQEYVSAWRHIVQKFRAVGATNVQWVWCPGADAWIHNTWQYFWPGPSYVDWVGIDDYNKGDTDLSFGTDPGIPQFVAAAPSLGKPMMIAENAAFNDPTMSPDPQTVWINTAHSFVKAHPEITAYLYWDSSAAAPPPPPYSGSGYWLQGTGLAAYKAMANDPYFTAPGVP